MDATTLNFLTDMAARNATSSDYARAEELALLAKLSDGVKECFDLQLLLDEVDLAEPDRNLAATLQEYGQKLGAMNREMLALRAQIQKVAGIRREIDVLEARVGTPMLEQATAEVALSPAPET